MPGSAPAALTESLSPDRLTEFRAVEAWTGARIAIEETAEGRYLVSRLDPNGSGRTEWRSEAWVRRAISDGHWLPVPQAGRGAGGEAAISM